MSISAFYFIAAFILFYYTQNHTITHRTLYSEYAQHSKNDLLPSLKHGDIVTKRLRQDGNMTYTLSRSSIATINQSIHRSTKSRLRCCKCVYSNNKYDKTDILISTNLNQIEKLKLKSNGLYLHRFESCPRCHNVAPL